MWPGASRRDRAPSARRHGCNAWCFNVARRRVAGIRRLRRWRDAHTQTTSFNVARRDSPGSVLVAGVRHSDCRSASMRPGAIRRDQAAIRVSGVAISGALQCGPARFARISTGREPASGRRHGASMRPGAIRQDQSRRDRRRTPAGSRPASMRPGAIRQDQLCHCYLANSAVAASMRPGAIRQDQWLFVAYCGVDRCATDCERCTLTP